MGTTNQNVVACEQNVQLACSDKTCIWSLFCLVNVLFSCSSACGLCQGECATLANQLQLEHLDGLWRCRKLTPISSLSSSTCKTHTSHQSSLYEHDTKSISSSTRSPSSIVTLSTFEILEEEWTLLRLALAANLFTVPPTPSQAPFPWEVAEKCHSAATPKSSCWCKLIKFLLFL